MNQAVNARGFARRVVSAHARQLLFLCALGWAGPIVAQDLTIGHFETRNIRWGIPPEGLRVDQRLLGNEAMHYAPTTHPPGEEFMSASYFPQLRLQIHQLSQLEFQMYMPQGSVCTGGSPRFVVQVTRADGQDPRDIYVYSTVGCATGAWSTLDYANPNKAHWSAERVGGASPATRYDAHRAAVAALGPKYRIRVVRINFDGGSGPEAWFDNMRVNGMLLTARLQDFSSNALLLDDSIGAGTPQEDAFLRALPMIGHFQSRNVHWGLAPQGLRIDQRLTGNEGMHFAPYTHSAEEDFMSTSFFPQNWTQVDALKGLSIQMFLPAGSSCAAGAPRLTVVVTNRDDTDRRSLSAYSTKACVNESWQTHFANLSTVVWAAQSVGGGSNTTRQAAHAAALEALGEDYRVYAVRTNFDGGAGPEAWFDNIKINESLFTSRFQDFSENALTLDGVLP